TRRARPVSHDLDDARRQPQGGLHGVGEARAVGLADHEPVHDHRDLVVLVPVQLRRLLEVVHLAVDPHAHEPLAADVLEQVAELALAAPDERRGDLDALALRPRHDPIHDLRCRLRTHGPAARRAVRCAAPRPQQAEIVVDLGDGPDGGARVAAGGLLLDGDRGRQALDHVHIRLLHHAEELARVGRQRLDVAALALGVDGVEGERRLAGTRQPRDHDEAVTRDLDVYVLQIVLAGAADNQRFVTHRSWLKTGSPPGEDRAGSGYTPERSPGSAAPGVAPAERARGPGPAALGSAAASRRLGSAAR